MFIEEILVDHDIQIHTCWTTKVFNTKVVS